MGISLDISVPVLTVFMQGLLSFFSPCVLPLIPIYIGYLSGGTTVRDEEGQLHYDRKKVFINTLFFVLGISFAFFLLGLGMNAVGRFFGSNQYLFARMGGVIIILFGLYQLGLFGDSNLINKERRLPFKLNKLKMSPITALIMGFVFSFAWTPCVGPTLSSVLLMSASASSAATGFALVGVYTLGFVIPFLLVGMFTTTLLSVFDKHKNVVKYTVKIGGVLMVLIGILMMTGHLNSITGYLSKVSQGTIAESPVEEDAEETATASADDENKAEVADAESETSKNAEDNSGDDINSTETAAEDDAASKSAGADESDSEVSASSEDSEESDESADAASTDSEEETLMAPDFTLVDQYGNTHSLSDYRGKLIFLNFWATWCPPCRAEMPDIQALYEEQQALDDPEVVVLGVAFPNFGDEVDTAGIISFLEENGYTYPVLMDDSYSVGAEYYITSYPTTFMIGPEGEYLGYVPGSMSRDMINNVIEQCRDMIKK